MTKRPYFYFMESKEEITRLEIKTDPVAVRRQALWCGVKPGLRVLDAGCGPGKTTDILYKMIQPRGEILGVDYSEARIAYAQDRYGHVPNMDFLLGDLRDPLNGIGPFDLIWVRFVLEYNRNESASIVGNLTSFLKPDGCLCLMDLDNNSLTHYPLTTGTAEVLQAFVRRMEQDFDFDPFAGRKLYSYLYDLDFRDIQVEMAAHHLIYGDNMRKEERFNWMKKFEVILKKMPEVFDSYPGGIETFQEDISRFFKDPRRFAYTPLILCKGVKPRAGSSANR
ncbi:MAG: class I SAM-dependent methyltransferase [Deltaproteobacteria bacterium]|nr:class I SAM-dependent methyltransferase [Deltaproteobacteria bacterium]